MTRTLVIQFATQYAALARKYNLAAEDAAYAAFEAMRTRAVRTAIDPWAVVTRAVQITLIYEARAQGLLCSNLLGTPPMSKVAAAAADAGEGGYL